MVTYALKRIALNKRLFLFHETAAKKLNYDRQQTLVSSIRELWTKHCSPLLSSHLHRLKYSLCLSLPLSLSPSLPLSLSLSVNKHKPWIETSYHGVITENSSLSPSLPLSLSVFISLSQ